MGVGYVETDLTTIVVLGKVQRFDYIGVEWGVTPFLLPEIHPIDSGGWDQDPRAYFMARRRQWVSVVEIVLVTAIIDYHALWYFLHLISERPYWRSCACPLERNLTWHRRSETSFPVTTQVTEKFQWALWVGSRRVIPACLMARQEKYWPVMLESIPWDRARRNASKRDLSTGANYPLLPGRSTAQNPTTVGVLHAGTVHEVIYRLC